MVSTDVVSTQVVSAHESSPELVFAHVVSAHLVSTHKVSTHLISSQCNVIEIATLYTSAVLWLVEAVVVFDRHLQGDECSQANPGIIQLRNCTMAS